MNKPKIIAIVGQTSSGKTSLSIKIAQKFNGEIISADSRQIYRGLDITTGKVTTEEMSGVPHHLLDIAEPMEIYTAADFERDVRVTISNILSRGKTPIIVGGTYFYIQLLRGELQSAPVAPNEEFRQTLEEFSNEELFERLKSLDSNRAEEIDPDNRHRLIRSLEIINKLGKVPIVEKVESEYGWLLIGTKINKDDLHTNIHLRTEQRMKAGMIEETKKLHEDGLTYERMNELGLEYRYLAQYLKAEISEAELFTQIETKNRQYAKRQLTWLKRDEDIQWFNPKDLNKIFDTIAKFLQQTTS